MSSLTTAAAESPAQQLARTRSWRIGGLVLTIAPILFLVVEAIAAMAWSTPRYSYAYNYISDLGIPDPGSFEGRTADSSLYVLWNIAGFMAQGVLVVAAAVILFRTVSAPVLRWVYLAIATLYGLGMFSVAIFHGSDDAVADGTVIGHVLGALPIFIGGNLITILIGIHLLRRRQLGVQPSTSRTLGGGFTALGIVGLVALFVLLSISGSSVDGLVERVSVYAVLAAQLIAGIGLLRSSRAALPARR